MPEEVEQSSSHEELLSEIERQKTIVKEKYMFLAERVRLVDELKKENQKLKELKDKLERECKGHEERNEQRLYHIIFYQDMHESRKKRWRG